MSKNHINHRELLEKLDPVRYEPPESGEENQLEQMALGGALPSLAYLDHEREYARCREVAEHLMGMLYQPEEVVIDEQAP